MKKTIVLSLLVLTFAATLVFAQSGDLIVNGALGVGTTSPQYAVDVNGDVNVTGSFRIDGQAVSQLNPTFRNRLTNCEMMIDQRNNGAQQTLGTYEYTIDRWYVEAAGTGLVGQRIVYQPSGPQPPAGFKGCYQITGTSGNTGLYFGQKIESKDISDLAGASVTLSFYLSSTSLSSINWQVYCPTGVDNFNGITYAAGGSWNISGNLSCYTATFTLPAGAVNGLLIQIQAPSGLNSGALTIAGAQLEAGTSATPLERLPVGMHFVRCLRYFQSLSGGAYVTYGIGIAYSPTGVVMNIPLSTPMRATPTMATSAMNTFQLAGTGGPAPSSMALGSSASAGCVSLYIGGTVTNMSPYLLQANSSAASFIQLSAEL